MAVSMTGQENEPRRSPLIPAPGFVGREAEMAAIGDALSTPPAVVLIEGEAGIGKSRLVNEFLSSPSGRRQTSLVAVCPPFRQPQTLAPVVDAVRRSVDDVAAMRLSALGGALRPLFPEWAARLPPAPEPAEDATAARHRLFRALAELFERLHAGVVVLEDAHWADEATLELLLFLASHEQHPSIVVTYRPEDVPPGSLLLRMPSRLRTNARQLRLVLGPLGVTEMATMMSSMLARHVSDEFAAFLHERTEGVPLAAEELVRLMVDRADLAVRDGRWVRRRLASIDVPPTIRDAVLERVARIGAPARAVLRAAAVFSEPAAEATLTAVCGLDTDGARVGLAEALRSGLLTEAGRGRVSFRHVLAGQAIYESIPVPERRLLHRRAGKALESWPTPPVARLARHFREAGETRTWARYAEQAADAALAVGDDATSAVLLHDLVTGVDLPARSVARLTNKMRLLALAEHEGLVDLLRVLRSLVEAGGLSPDEEAEVRFQLGRVLLVAGESEAYRSELERAVHHLGHDPVATARAMTLLGIPLGRLESAQVHLRWLRRAADAAAALEPAERLRLAVDRTTALLILGEEAGWEEAERLPSVASTGYERLQVTRAHLNVGGAAMTWGRYAEARRRLTQAVELAERYGYWRMRGTGLSSLASLDWYTGSWSGLADRADGMAGDPEITPVARLEAALVAGQLHAVADWRSQAGQRLEQVLDEAWQRGSERYVPEPAAALARLWLADGRIADALQVTDKPAALVANTGTWLLATELGPARVEALVAAGRLDEADELVRAFAGWLPGRNAPAARAALTVCRALLADARGEPVPAAALFAEAAAAWEQLPRPYHALLALERQAGCLLDADQVESGVRLLSEVFERLRDLGARRDADRIADRLRAHGVRVTRPWRGGRRGYGDQLSPRELDVVRLLVDGRTNRQIAEALVVSRQTVAEHVRSAMRKLGVSTRTALAVKVVELGVLADGDRPAR